MASTMKEKMRNSYKRLEAWYDRLSKYTILSITTCVFAIIALFLSLSGNFRCQQVTQEVTVSSPVGSVTGTISFGIWSWQQYNYVAVGNGSSVSIIKIGTCKRYGSGDGIVKDAMWRTAAAFTIIAVLVGFVLTVGTIVVTFKKQVYMPWWVISAGCFMNTFFEGLIFLFSRSDMCTRRNGTTGQGYVFTSPSWCTLSKGGGIVITACFFWFFTSGLAACTSVLKPYTDDADEKATVQDDKGGVLEKMPPEQGDVEAEQSAEVEATA